MSTCLPQQLQIDQHFTGNASPVCQVTRLQAPSRNGVETAPLKRLASGGLWLWCRTLCSLLADHTIAMSVQFTRVALQMSVVYAPSSRLPLRSTRSVLSLLRLLYTLCSRTFLFALLDRFRASCRTGLWTHGASLLDYVERSAYHSTLGFDGTASAGLGLLLFESSDHRFTRLARYLEMQYLGNALSPLSPA